MDHYGCEHYSLLSEHIIAQVSVLTRSTENFMWVKQKEMVCKQTQTLFQFHGVPVCKELWLFEHTVGIHRYKNLKQCFLQGSIAPKQHGNTGRSPGPAVSAETLQKVVTFIQHYTD